jgi:sugar lactone lactonase YvrE
MDERRKRHVVLLTFLISVVLVTTFGVGYVTSADISVGEGSGEIIVTSHAGQTVTLIESTGERKWVHSGDGTYFGVSVVNQNEILVGFETDNHQRCPDDPPCRRTGVRHFSIENDSPTIREEWSYLIGDVSGHENHDVEVAPNGGYYVSDMANERIGHVRDGEATWIWNASEFYDEPSTPQDIDWLHINDVDRIDSGKYLVSVRNANQILIIEEKNGVVDVINPDTSGADEHKCASQGLKDFDGDGEVRCGDSDVLWGQHNPQWVSEGVVLVADSNNNRVVEFHRTNGSWEEVWELGEAGGMRFAWPRDADRLPNGNTLITDTGNNRVVEVTPRGSLVASFKLPTGVYEADAFPQGEYPAGQKYARSITTFNAGSYERQELPVLSRLLHAAHFVMPVPHWIDESHVAATLFTLLGVGLIVERLVSHLFKPHIRHLYDNFKYFIENYTR